MSAEKKEFAGELQNFTHKIIHKFAMYSEQQIREMLRDRIIMVIEDGTFLIDTSRLPVIKLTVEQANELKKYPMIVELPKK